MGDDGSWFRPIKEKSRFCKIDQQPKDFDVN